MAHTPTPWTINEVPEGNDSGMVEQGPIIEADDISIAEICGGIGPAECLANAHLIAAAPELLEVDKDLHDVLSDILEMDGTNIPDILRAKALNAIEKSFKAIAKAEGK